MSDLVQLGRDNGITIITINNPPVNALSPGVPEGVLEAIEQTDGRADRRWPQLYRRSGY